MRVGVIGTGHVGLVTCATLAALGHEVMGTDSDPEKIAGLHRGVLPYYEPGLHDLVHREMEVGRLGFALDPAEAIAGADVAFLCVGTPPRATGEANLVAVERSAREVATRATGPLVVAEKSTVPAGTAKRVKRTLLRVAPELGRQLHVVSNPEFLREGRAVEDSLHPDRILVGAESPQAFEVMRRVYAPLLDQGCTLIETDIATAELAKHACNAFLALKISFVNALARLCERSGGDVVAVADVMGSDQRIGRAFLDAGLGYGGYCFPKDLQAFERLAQSLGYEFPLLREVARINQEAVEAAAQKVEEAVWNLEGKRITLLGLSFKPGTDDIRFSPGLELARRLLHSAAEVVGYDPRAMGNAKSDLPELEVAMDAYEAAAGAHCVVLCTEWDEFRGLDLGKLAGIMADPVVVDGRNMFEPQAMREAGITYYPTGRPPLG
jgi:UDPglucose 6-dehydrogenase